MDAVGKKLVAIAFLLYLALFVAGIVRSYTLPEPDVSDLSVSSALPVSYSREDDRSQLRTANNLSQIGLVQTPLPQVLADENVHKIQVYEKTANVTSGTVAFTEDEERTRAAISGQKATVFNERSTGIAPHRKLALAIAVHPDRFDTLLQELQQVGRVLGLFVQQQDRTSEFRKLHAQRQSLTKHQEAILKLRNAHKLSVEEALKLEQKIQELEKESQAVGVQLGDLLGKEPSYNLFLSLDESPVGGSGDRSFTLTRRLGSACVWALGWWLVAALGLGLVGGTYLSIQTLWPGASSRGERPTHV